MTVDTNIGVKAHFYETAIIYIIFLEFGVRYYTSECEIAVVC